MAKYFIEIDTSNDAFDPIEYELADILEALSERVRSGAGFDHTLRDSNGNRVGSSYLEEDEPDELVEDTSDAEEEEEDYGV